MFLFKKTLLTIEGVVVVISVGGNAGVGAVEGAGGKHRAAPAAEGVGLSHGGGVAANGVLDQLLCLPEKVIM